MVKRINQSDSMIKNGFFVKKIGMFLMLLIVVCAMQRTVSAETKIMDQAELFETSDIQKMESIMKQIDDQYHMNVLVLTTNDAEGKTSGEYLEDSYEELGYHENDERGGIALIIDMDNRELNLVTERDMIYYITDEREEEIYDQGYDYIQDYLYGDCMNAMLKQTALDLQTGIPGNQYIYDSETGEIIRYKSVTGSDFMIALVGSFLCALSTCLILYRKYSVVKKFNYSTNQNAAIRITGGNEQLVNQFVTQRKIPKNPPSGGGGSHSGRTTTHRSSSGHSYGGGHGRKF